MASDAQPCPLQRSTHQHPPKPPYDVGEIKHEVPPNLSDSNHSPFSTLKEVIECVICGDRACSHLYYGVSACHGCKCFFWRTVKTTAKYVCRYDGNCKISTAGRNACRFCRFNRCLAVGMKIESVRMEKRIASGGNTTTTGYTSGSTSTLRKATKSGAVIQRPPKREREKRPMSSHESDFEADWDMKESEAAKRQRMDNRILINSLLLIDRNANEGAGHAATAAPETGQPVTLRQAFDNPKLLDKYRNVLRFDRKEPADCAMLADSARRLLTWTMDWTRLVCNLEEALDTTDKMKLLRNCFAPLTLLELGTQTLVSPASILLLPGPGYIYHDGTKLPDNCFLNNKIVSKILSSLRTRLVNIALDEKEVVMLKAIIVLNPDADCLALHAAGAVNSLRTRAHSALYQHIVDKSDAPKAAARLANILLLIPNLMLLAGELVEHIRMAHTFSANSTVYDPLLYQLFGDIFEDSSASADQRGEGPHSLHSSSCSPIVEETCVESA
ncbi:unnamed protein product, partial [Mesorhabditis belari]|uniref:Uncharacterized protein n=1 Tax=Mesorhabditis belari TaxID=2138241 RepID=A0AAF3FGT2_9BILA